jgi:hypothetical protein
MGEKYECAELLFSNISQAVFTHAQLIFLFYQQQKIKRDFLRSYILGLAEEGVSK